MEVRMPAERIAREDRSFRDQALDNAVQALRFVGSRTPNPARKRLVHEAIAAIEKAR